MKALDKDTHHSSLDRKWEGRKMKEGPLYGPWNVLPLLYGSTVLHNIVTRSYSNYSTFALLGRRHPWERMFTLYNKVIYTTNRTF
jgi:hypothetical protein